MTQEEAHRAHQRRSDVLTRDGKRGRIETISAIGLMALVKGRHGLEEWLPISSLRRAR